MIRDLAEELAARALVPVLERVGVLAQLRQLQELRRLDGQLCSLPEEPPPQPLAPGEAPPWDRIVRLKRAPVAGRLDIAEEDAPAIEVDERRMHRRVASAGELRIHEQ